MGMLAVFFCLALGVIVGALTGCTIERVVLYETVNYPAVVVTPTHRIGPS